MVPRPLCEEHGIETLVGRHEYRGLERLHGATSGDGHGHRRSGDVVRYLKQDDHVVVSEGVVSCSLTSPSAQAGSSACFAINPLLGRLKRNGLGFRFRWNTLVKWHDDTGMTTRGVSRLPDLDHR